MVEHHLVECVLLLCDLAVAQDVALILGVVVTHELLFAILDLHPVTVLHGSGVAGACLLLVHLAVEALLVDGETVLAADQFGEVERETVGVEEAESLLAVELRLGVLLQFVHVAVEQLDALLQGAQEAVFLLLDYTADELLLCGQFGVSAAHLMNEHGNELIHERSLLVEERVGVAHGAAQPALALLGNWPSAMEKATALRWSATTRMAMSTFCSALVPSPLGPSGKVWLYFLPERFSISVMMDVKMSVS